jgi:hypothetical protein
MDAICPVGEVCVDRASHDSAMIRHSVVKRNEVFSVDRQDGTISRYGIVDTASSAIRRLAFPAPGSPKPPELLRASTDCVRLDVSTTSTGV